MMTPAYAPPPVPSSVIELTKENVTEVLSSRKLIVIDMWASWCGPCKMFMPVFVAVADSYADNPDVVFAKCNIDEQPWIASQLVVKSVPTVMVTRGEQVLFRESRVLGAAELTKAVELARRA